MAEKSSIRRIYIPRWLLPTPGNMIFTMLVVVGLLWTQRAGALSDHTSTVAIPSTSTIPYQGRLADSAGNSITATTPMTFRLYAADSGGTALWVEPWPNVAVNAGLFNVMLGSNAFLPQTLITSNSSLWLGISVGNGSQIANRHRLYYQDWAFGAQKLGMAYD